MIYKLLYIILYKLFTYYWSINIDYKIKLTSMWTNIFILVNIHLNKFKLIFWETEWSMWWWRDDTWGYWTPSFFMIICCCCHGHLAPLAMGDSRTSTVLTRYEPKRLQSLRQNERTTAKGPVQYKRWIYPWYECANA